MFNLYHGPKAVVFFITYKCDAHCKMCSAWTKQKQDSELSLNEIEDIFKDPGLSTSLQVVNITGGEPTLRPDLSEIVKILIRHCINLRRIDIPTNGFNTENVIDQIEKILALLTPTDVKLAVTFSVDGIGASHDRVRGVSGGFEKLVSTLHELKGFLRIYSNLSISLNTTISRYNYSALEEILMFARQENINPNFTPAALSEIGSESKLFFEQFSLDADARDTVIAFLKQGASENILNSNYIQFVTGWLRTGMRNARCNFRNRNVFLLEPSGEAYLCGNFKDMYMGKLKKESFSGAWANIKRIPHNAWKRCLNCASNCYMYERL